MENPAVSVLAVIALLLASVYLMMLLGGQFRRASISSRMAEAELALFNQKVDSVTRLAKAEREASELSWNGLRKFRIAKKQMEAKAQCSFYLAPHDGRPLPPFKPGQYLTFSLNVPGQKKPVIRCYSLSDSPMHPDYYRLTIKKVAPPRDKPDVPPGLSSSFFHEGLNEEDIIDVRAPNGHFFLDMSRNSPVVLIGGGIGITPVLSMLNAIVESGSKRETWFFYGVTNSDEHVFAEHLKRIALENENVNLRVCYSRPKDDDVQGEHYDVAGRVSVDLFKEQLPSNNFDYYICAAPPMMESIVFGLEEWGVPEANVHYEAFGPATVKKASTAKASTDTAATDSVAELEVNFSKSGKVLKWKAEDGPLLDLAEDNDVTIDYACRAGNCGTCVTALKSGEVEYSSEPGAPIEAGTCLPCVATPKGPVVLDA